MAGKRESPSAKANRDKAARGEKGKGNSEGDAQHVPPEEIEVLEASATGGRVYGRRVADNEQVSMVASAARIDLKDRKAIESTRRRRQAWQTESWDYYDEIGESGYCVDDATEILTSEGWVTHDRLAPGDLVLTLNHESGAAEWQPATAVHRFPTLRRRMLLMQAPGHSSLTTGPHRWPTLHYRGRSARDGYLQPETSRRWATSDTLSSHDRLVTAAPVLGLPTEPKWSDAFVELVAWFWTEGSVRRNGDQPSQRVTLYQSHRANPAHVDRIRVALTEVYGPPVTSLRSGARQAPPAWREHTVPGRGMTHFLLNAQASAPLAEVAPDRVVGSAFVLGLTRAQLELFIDRSVMADGWFTPTGRAITQRVRGRLAALELACILTGRTPHVYDDGRGQWMLGVSDKTTFVPRRQIRTWVEHDGLVWCPETPNRSWLARRQGTVYFTGNTIDFAGNLLSKVRLFAAVRPDPHGEPVPVDSEDSGVDETTAKLCMDTLDRLRSAEGGQTALQREMTINFEVAGEALDVDTLVATPGGFARMGDLEDGDTVLGGDGRSCQVVTAHPIREDRDCYEVRLTGDIRVVADGEHLWTTHTQRDRQYERQWGRPYEPSVVTTAAMAETLKWQGASGQAANHAIELSSVIGTDPRFGAEIDPYVLGYWLGDGTSVQGAITVHPDDQPHLRERVEAAGYGWSPRKGHLAQDGRGFYVGILGLQAQLRRMGLLGAKRIPAAYLRHTEAARWALLQGLIDSDGHVDKRGRVEFSNTNAALLWDVAELVSTLGLRASRPSRHRVGFNSAGGPVASLPRKFERIVPAKQRDRWRYVQSVEQVKSRPVRCITVDSPDRTFLVTTHMIRTHNCYLHGHEDPDTGEEDWNIRSVDELIVTGDVFALRLVPGYSYAEQIPKDDLVVRLWQRHSRFSQLATCAMRRVLGEAESLLLLSREIRATSKSRLSAGLLLVPSEISFGSADPTRSSSDGEGNDDPFEDELTTAMVTPIQQEGSAGAVVPLVVRAPAAMLKEIRLVELQKSLDPTLDKRIEGRVMRIARGLNMPVEVTTGLQECVDSRTEILTTRGWLHHVDLVDGDRVLTLNHGSGFSEWQPVKRVARYQVDDHPMLRLQSKAHSSLTTLDHRWPVIDSRSQNRVWTESRALTDRLRFQTAAPCLDLPVEPKWSDAFVELVAWFYTEGHVDRRAHRSGGVTIITQSQARNPENVQRIRACLQTLIGPPVTKLNGTGPSWKAPSRPQVRAWVEATDRNRPITRFRLSHSLTAELEVAAPGKVPTAEFVLSLTAAQLELFLDISRRADGWMVNSGTRMFSQAEPRRVDGYELACILSGRTPSRWSVIAGKGRYAGIVQHFCSITDRSTIMPILSRYPPTEERYTGTVWCPSVDNGTWLARRDGRVYFTGNTTFANATQVKKSEWDAHGQPRAILMVDALTAGYYQPALEEAGVPKERVRDFFIWFDESAAISAPDPVDHVEQAHKDGLISDEARRRIQGYNEADAPGDDELLRRLLWNSPRMDPFILAQILKLTGLMPDLQIPAPAGGVISDTGTLLPASLPVPAGQAAPTGGAVAAAGIPRRSGAPRRRTDLGRHLMEIDRDLRTRVHAAVDSAMKRALEKAGNRIKAKAGRTRGGETSVMRRIAAGVGPSHVAAAVGPALVAAIGLTDDQLLSDSFDGVTADVGAWIDMAQAQSIKAVEAVVGPLHPAVLEALATNQITSREAATAQLGRSLTTLAGQRLYDPTPGAVLGEMDPTAAVPMSIVRETLGIAGGATPLGGQGSPLVDGTTGGLLGGVATGSDVMGVVQSAGGSVDGYVWDYGAAVRKPFEPHLALDGVEFVNFDDPVLANEEGFPDLAFFMPGDHDGCFPAGTVVSGPAPRGATLRWYEGPLVEVALASGQFLTATANHPVLTERGWVPAQFLEEGDHVVRGADAERIANLVPGDHQVPAVIEEVVRSFGERRGMLARRVKVASENFHRDGAGSQVAVVWTDRNLGNGVDAPLDKPGSQQALGGADPMVRRGLARQSGTTASIEGVGPAALGLESMGRDGTTSLGRPGSKDEALSFADAPDPHATLPQPLRHCDPIHAESLGQSLDGLAGAIELDKVIDVRRTELWSGQVYNLETVCNWYMANGIVVRNCACDVTPTVVFVTAPGDEPSSDTSTGVDTSGGMLDALRSEGGFTIDPRLGSEVTEGYSVALAGFSSITPAADFFAGPAGQEAGRGIVAQWLADNASVFDDSHVHVGGWWDKEHNEITLDPVHVIANKDEAIAAGVARDQQAIYDLKNGVEIPTGGTGGRTQAVLERATGYQPPTALSDYATNEKWPTSTSMTSRGETGRLANAWEKGLPDLASPGLPAQVVAKQEVAHDVATRMGTQADQLLSPAYHQAVAAGDPFEIAYNPDTRDYFVRPGGAVGSPTLPGGYVAMDGTSAEAVQAMRETEVSRLIGTWATTSNDTDPLALALQETARSVFVLQDTAPWDISEPNLEQMKWILDNQGEALGAFLRAQYASTQEWFATNGFTELDLARGMEGTTLSFLQPEGWNAGSFVARPLSSWAWSPGTAWATFSREDQGLVMVAKMPVSRILSLPRTGMGCLNENELIVLGGPMQVSAANSNWIGVTNL